MQRKQKDTRSNCHLIKDFDKFFKVEKKVVMQVLACYYVEKAEMYVITQEKQK